jgi:hypothetical protein
MIFHFGFLTIFHLIIVTLVQKLFEDFKQSQLWH